MKAFLSLVALVVFALPSFAANPFSKEPSLLEARTDMVFGNQVPVTSNNGCTVTYFQIWAITIGDCWEYKWTVGTEWYYECKSTGDDCDVFIEGNDHLGQKDYNVEMGCGEGHFFTFDTSNNTMWFDSYSCPE